MDEVLNPVSFFATIRVRETLFRAGRPVRARALARFLRVDHRELVANLVLLAQVGLASETATGAYQLTDEGEASVRWSAPPPPDGVIRQRWVTELAAAVADHYQVTVAQVLRDDVGAAVVARSRLCFALYARGWALERIEEHFGLPGGWARRAVERWKRLRDQVVPRTGAELRAWRERLGLTQAQAAARLGVNRRTIIRAERLGTFSPRLALGRA